MDSVHDYLLATFMLIFGLGLYELFISPIDEVRENAVLTKILIVKNIDDLKNRLAKVVIMIIIMKLFEEAIKLHIVTSLDLLYLGVSIALVGLALYLGHAAPSRRKGSME